ncbi:hypothetical protein [Bradyrhizobium sp. CB3481]|uniref:hypothetical protein n=1 Tax=Bradyrhizobium sp. CB3481 TaxID=3039158 RepID=UPI0024B2789D|nr:hypothetical protein [Bradyrhizobium sp. CB3481]WFU19940.1 hypothetical protein QA643_17215 [Bradyrhizobium sp. CB3481]
MFGLAALAIPTTREVSKAAGLSIPAIAAAAEFLSKAAESIAKLGDSVAHISQLGTQGYDAVAARRTHAELIELRKKLLTLVHASNFSFSNRIQEYLKNPSDRGWDAVITQIAEVGTQVNTLLESLGSTRSDFVLEEAYSTLQQALSGRASILVQLRSISRPTSPEELAALEQMAKEYSRLSRETLAATNKLADYIKSLK